MLLKESQADAIEMLEALAEEVTDAQSTTYIEAVGKGNGNGVSPNWGGRGDTESLQPLNPALRAEQAAYGGLLKLRAREFQITRQQQNQSQSKGASQQKRQKQLEDLELEEDENRYESQQEAQANSEQEQQQKEVRQVLSRLRELARRQEDLNKQLAELQSALEQAKTEEEKKEIERQLEAPSRSTTGYVARDG